MKEDPSDCLYTILQDHGETGWGPALVVIPLIDRALPIVYTGDNAQALANLGNIAVGLAAETGKPTILARYTNREDLLVLQ